MQPQESNISQYKEKRLDLPIESAIWLQQFRFQNTPLLNELNVSYSNTNVLLW